MIVLAKILMITMLVVVPLYLGGYLVQKDGEWSFGKEPCHLKKRLADHQEDV